MPKSFICDLPAQLLQRNDKLSRGARMLYGTLRALANGKVRVYVNCVFVGQGDTTTVVGNTYVNQGGRIGVWYQDAPNALFDNFGGGNVP